MIVDQNFLLKDYSFIEKGKEECREDDGKKFFLGNDEIFPESDFWLSLEADRFDFAMRVTEGEDGLFHTIRI